MRIIILSIKKVLSKETPLMFLWMVKYSEKLENNNPIPNHAEQEENYKSYQEKGFDISSIKDIEKPDTKLNSFTSLVEMAARKIIDKPSRS
ncbi:hypothetical protein [Wolbachia endosymbiont (group E) of Neria commutata]|uniref:hypothetical protein n=1 Tax=Wolbachia endosymbiont (group E) of Neria commutata TaxID=3066149 RepID=UPI003132CBF5